MNFFSNFLFVARLNLLKVYFSDSVLPLHKVGGTHKTQIFKETVKINAAEVVIS